jgi:hypothetical protein
MATAEQIVKGSLRKAGNSNPTNTELSDGLERLNDLLSSWSAERLLTHVNVRETYTLTASQGTYTWGSGVGSDISTARPIQLADIYIRDSSGNDYPIEIINEEFYNDISLKTTEGRPERAYLATEYTKAKLFLYPVPDSAETLQISSWKALSEISTLSSTVSLPNEYKLPLVSNLLIEVAGDYGYEPTPTDHRNAETAKARLFEANSKNIMTKFPNAITKYKTLNIDNLRFI